MEYLIFLVPATILGITVLFVLWPKRSDTVYDIPRSSREMTPNTTIKTNLSPLEICEKVNELIGFQYPREDINRYFDLCTLKVGDSIRIVEYYTLSNYWHFGTKDYLVKNRQGDELVVTSDGNYTHMNILDLVSEKDLSIHRKGA